MRYAPHRIHAFGGRLGVPGSRCEERPASDLDKRDKDLDRGTKRRRRGPRHRSVSACFPRRPSPTGNFLWSGSPEPPVRQRSRASAVLNERGIRQIHRRSIQWAKVPRSACERRGPHPSKARVWPGADSPETPPASPPSPGLRAGASSRCDGRFPRALRSATG